MPDQRNGFAEFLLPNCRALRVEFGKSITSLAKAADVSRDTIARKIERGAPVTEPIANAVFNALNAFAGNSLDRKKQIVRLKN